MADKETPARASNVEKPEGDRWTSDPDTVEVSDRYADVIGENSENSGGISNRPLEEEIERQHTLPDRGTRRDEDRGKGDIER